MNRVLSAEPVGTLHEYLAGRGGVGLEAARAAEPDAVIAELEAAGLRGRGGAGFPTGKKWRTVLDNRAEALPTTVIVNGAEGEPGTFKDRAILMNNPFQVVEGALIAAVVLGVPQVVFAVKRSSPEAVQRLQNAVDEFSTSDLAPGVEMEVFQGPDEYLYGEETALLEVLNGRPPFPRIAPPYRRGLQDVVESAADLDTGSGLSAHVTMANAEAGDAPPALIDNVETMANIPGIVANGAAWFREFGTDQSPGTIVCTISGGTVRADVGEVAMGTTLREAIIEIGGGLPEGRTVKAVLPGVANALIPGAAVDTPLTYEAMAGIGSGLGSAGFVIYTDEDDLVGVVAGVSRFLAVESCGQCTPCKQDGLALSVLLDRVSQSEATVDDVDTIRSLVHTVADEARCSLAAQHEAVVAGLLNHFAADVTAHLDGQAAAAAPVLIAEVVDLRDGQITLDDRHGSKQPDWTYDAEDSGKTPVERFSDHRATGSNSDVAVQ